MTDCFFCKIIKKEAPAEIIYEDADAIAFLDIHPKAPAHTMVLPKVHAETILDLPEKKVEKVFRAVKNVTELLNKALKPDGFTIGINHGEASGRIIEHLHIHVMPRWLNDGGGSVHNVVNNPPKQNLIDIKTLITTNRNTKNH